MKKSLTVLAAATMVFSSTAAHALTRPEPTEFQQPVVDESGLAGEESEGLLALLLLGGAGLIAILLAAGGSHGNSPR